MRTSLSLFSVMALLMAGAGAAHAESYSVQSHASVHTSESDGVEQSKTVQIDGETLDGVPVSFSLNLESTNDPDVQEIKELFHHIEDLLEQMKDEHDEETNEDKESEDDEDTEGDGKENEDDENEHEEDAFSATINAEQEVPPVDSTGSGTGVFHLEGDDLHYTLHVSDLTTPVTAAHFHAAPRGENGDVVEPIPTNSGTSLTVSGTWEDLTEQELEWLQDEEIYVNVHTEQYPAGEVRGQVEGK